MIYKKQVIKVLKMSMWETGPDLNVAKLHASVEA